jgi:hypothetical protein
MNLFAMIAGLLSPGVTPQEIRLEILNLGSRHRGEPLGGAILELNAAELAPERSRLLQAVVSQLTRPSSPVPGNKPKT